MNTFMGTWWNYCHSVEAFMLLVNSLARDNEIVQMWKSGIPITTFLADPGAINFQ